MQNIRFNKERREKNASNNKLEHLFSNGTLIKNCNWVTDNDSRLQKDTNRICKTVNEYLAIKWLLVDRPTNRPLYLFSETLCFPNANFKWGFHFGSPDCSFFINLIYTFLWWLTYQQSACENCKSDVMETHMFLWQFIILPNLIWRPKKKRGEEKIMWNSLFVDACMCLCLCKNWNSKTFRSMH